MLHTEVSRLWSKGVINVFTDSRAGYDPDTNALTKFGENLKADDVIYRRVNEDGNTCDDYHSWRVAELVYTRSLGIDDLKVGEEYGVYIRLEQAVLPFKLVGVDLDQQVSPGLCLSGRELSGRELAHNIRVSNFGCCFFCRRTLFDCYRMGWISSRSMHRACHQFIRRVRAPRLTRMCIKSSLRM
jgi:hypothetical protein